MKKMLALIAMSFIPAQSALSQVSALPGQAASEFAFGVQREIHLMKPVDAFQNSQCGLVDAKFFAPVTLKQAQRAILPCLDSISKKYGVQIKARVGSIVSSNPKALTAQVQILLLDVAQSLSITHPLVRDLNYGLSLRRGRIFGVEAQLFPVRQLAVSKPAFHATLL